MGDWASYKPSEQEVEKAHEVAENLSTPDEEGEIRLAKGGRKRWQAGRAQQPPLTDCSQEQSETLRDLVAAKFAGYTQREAFKKLDLNASTALSLMRRKEVALEEATHEHLERAMSEYHTNLWMLRAALSEMGVRAVRTLGAVMDDKKEKGFTRAKAAELVLKLADIKGTASKNGPEAQAEFLVTLKDNRSGLETEAVHIVDAKYEEVDDEAEYPS